MRLLSRRRGGQRASEDINTHPQTQIPSTPPPPQPNQQLQSNPNSSSLKSISSIPTISSISPLIFSKNNTSNNNNNNSNTSETSYNTIIKILEHSLSKFNNLKKNSPSRANIIRLHLLPYLRYPPYPFTNINILLSTSLIDLNIDSLHIFSSILISWSIELLNMLILDYNLISSLDKNCYFEALSRLISHNIWFIYQLNLNYSSQFTSIYESYRKLLLKTFQLSIQRLNSKNISQSISIFVGKIFAFSFYHLNDISKGLLFLLNTKLINFKKLINTNIDPTILNDLSSKFPSHLSNLIHSNQFIRSVNYSIESHFINSMIPPREKIIGLDDTKGIWVNRWSSFDNISIFCSFLRNYLSISSIYLKNFPLLMINDNYITNLPGYSQLITHIYEIFDFQIKNQLIKYSNSKNNKNININNLSNDNYLFVIPPNVSQQSNIDKLFNLLSDVLQNPRHESEILLCSGLIKSYEKILKLFILKTNILDSLMIETLFDIFVQFLNHIYIESTKANLFTSLDWSFWLDVLIKLLDSNNSNAEIKTLTTIYQIWDYIPDQHIDSSFHWISKPNESSRLNFALYLINNENWFKFFGHYMPLERDMYIKLIVWKILGINSLENIIHYNNYKFKHSLDQSIIGKIILQNLNLTYSKTDGLIFKPFDPIINKKFIISPILDKDEIKRDNKLRIYPYEILDDAIYSVSSINSEKISSKTSLKKTKSNETTKSNNTWIGKIFNKNNSNSNSNNNCNNNLKNLKNKSDQSIDENKSIGKFLNISKPTPIKDSSFSINDSPISSISSSLSSLELMKNDSFNNSISPDDLSQPPEWNQQIEINKSFYEFKLINNKQKINSFLQRLNTFNNNNYLFKELLIINDEPKLPSIDVNKLMEYKFNKISPSLESLVTKEEKDEILNGNVTPTGISNDYNYFIDTNNGFDYINNLNITTGFDDEIDFGYNTGTKILDDGLNEDIKECTKKTSASLNYLSNGLLTYNEEVNSFQNFITDQLMELSNNPESDLLSIDDYTDHCSVSSSSLLEIPPINKSFKLNNNKYNRLKLSIPNIIPHIKGDRLNAS